MLTVQTSTTQPLFIWRGDYSTKDVPKQAGFRWNPDAKHWWTQDATKAQRLTKYATPEALTALAPTTTALAESRASGPLLQADGQAVDDTPIPFPAGVTPYPYQLAGIRALLKRQNCLLGDDMGLGKSMQVLGVINADLTIKRVLIVTMSHLKINWLREIGKFSTRADLTVGEATTKVTPQTDITVAHYDIFSRACPSRDALRNPATAYDLICLDECDMVKEQTSARSKFILGFERKGHATIPPIPARRRIYASGTPMLNKPQELFGVLNSLDPVTFPNFFSFGMRYCAGHKIRIGYGKTAWDFTGASHQAELQDKLRAGGLMIRRLKTDPNILDDLPPKTRQVIEVDAEGDIDPADAAFLARLRAEEAAVDHAKHDQAAYALAVKKLNATMASFEEISALRLSIAQRKLPAIIAHCQAIIDSGEPLVVFGHHRVVLEAIGAAFPGVSEVAHGGKTIEERDASVQRFQTDESCKLIVCGIHSMGAGHTLTRARILVMAELDWTPARVSQCEDRIHRIGQRDKVLIQHVVLANSLDCHVAHTLVKKQGVIDAGLDESTAITVDLPETAPSNRADPSPRLAASVVAAIHANLRTLAGVCDGARDQDGMGYNGLDSAFGKSLAARPTLTDRQALAARKMLAKYKGQLGPTATAAMFD